MTRVTLIVRETARLTRDQRAEADDLLAGNPARLDDLERFSDRRLVGELARIAAELDVHAVAARRRPETPHPRPDHGRHPLARITGRQLACAGYTPSPFGEVTRVG